MKAKYFILIVSILTVFNSCKNADDFKDVLYFTGTEETPELKFTVEEPSSMGITVRSSAKVDSEVKIKLKADESLVERYNKEYGRNYKLLPKGSYNLSETTTTIPVGNFSSTPIKFSITSVENFKDEDIYCMPIVIANVEGGDYPILETSRVLYVIVNKTIITKATILDGTYFQVDFGSDPGRDLTSVSALTMEARIFVKNYQLSDPYISTVMGLEEHFILRFGDVKIKPDQLQLAGGGYPVSSPTSLPSGRWVHVAATYDGSRACLYIDGVLSAYTAAPRGKINMKGIDNTRGFYIGRTSRDYSRYLKGNISEARVWTRALSQPELANGICAVDPKSPDLLAYWKFNSYKADDAKNIVIDLTGHGYDAVGNREVSFVEGVRCP